MARPKNLRQQRLAGEIHQYLADILRTFSEETPEMQGIFIELTDDRLTPDLQQVRGISSPCLPTRWSTPCGC